MNLHEFATRPKFQRPPSLGTSGGTVENAAAWGQDVSVSHVSSRSGLGFKRNIWFIPMVDVLRGKFSRRWRQITWNKPKFFRFPAGFRMNFPAVHDRHLARDNERHISSTSSMPVTGGLSFMSFPGRIAKRKAEKGRETGMRKKHNPCWLVVSTPEKNISQLGWLFPISGKIKNVPNHQPAWNWCQS